MTIYRAHPRQQGFTMLEVLIAVLIFSLGIIGVAGLLIFSIQSNHVAYLRTQVTFLAHNMANRMGANPVGLWSGDYNITAIKAGGTAVSSCAAGCSSADLATHDIEAWSQQLHTFLPEAKADITCVNPTSYTPTAAQLDLRPPYGGTCTMHVTWNEAGGAGGSQQGSVQTGVQGQQEHKFAWVFQP